MREREERMMSITNKSIEKAGVEFLKSIGYKLSGTWPDQAKTQYYAQTAILSMKHENMEGSVTLGYSKVDKEVSIESVQEKKLERGMKRYPDCAYAIVLFLQRAFMDKNTTVVKINLPSETSLTIKCLQGARAVPFGMEIKVTKKEIHCTVTRRNPYFYAEKSWESLRNTYNHVVDRYVPYQTDRYAMDSTRVVEPMLYDQFNVTAVGDKSPVVINIPVALHGNEFFTRLRGGSRFEDEQQLYAVTLLFQTLLSNKRHAGMHVIMYTDITTIIIAEGLLAALKRGDIEHFHIISDEIYKAQLAK